MKVLTLILGLGLLLATLACVAPPASPPPTPMYLPTVTPTWPAAVATPPAAAIPADTAATPAADPATDNPPETIEPRRAIFDNEDERHHQGLGRADNKTLWSCSGGTGADTSDPLEGLASYEYDRPRDSQLHCEAKARRQWLAQRR